MLLCLVPFCLQNNMLVWSESQRCLAVDDEGDGVVLTECEEGAALQQWHFTHYNPTGLPYTDLA